MESIGKNYFLAKDYKNALIQFEKLIQLYPNYKRGHWWKTKVECELRNFKEVAAYLHKHTGVKPESAEDYFYKGSDSYFNKRYDESITLFLKSIEIDPGFIYTCSNPLNSIGLSYLHKNEFTEALTWFEKAINRNPSFEESYCNKATTLNQLERYEEALIFVCKAIDMKPKYYEALAVKGKALLFSGRYKEAIRTYEEAIKVGPSYSENEMVVEQKKLALMMDTHYPNGSSKSEFKIIFNLLDSVPRSKNTVITNMRTTSTIPSTLSTTPDKDILEMPSSSEKNVLNLKESTPDKDIIKTPSRPEKNPMDLKALDYKSKIDGLMSLGKYEEAKSEYKSGLKVMKSLFDKWPEMNRQFKKN